VRFLSHAIPGAAAGQLAIQSAELADAQAAKTSDDVVGKIMSSGFERMLNRSLHRLDHLRKMQGVLG
jgi:hypothetical protein